MDVPKYILRLMALIAAGQDNGFTHEFCKLAGFQLFIKKELYTIDPDDIRALTDEGWRVLREYSDALDEGADTPTGEDRVR